MPLYKALRVTTDELLQQSLKDRIELPIEQTQRSHRSEQIGSKH